MNTQLDESQVSLTKTHVETLPAHGVWVPPVTPVTEDLSPDIPRWLEHLHWLLGAGCHGLSLFGTTSEANSFSMSERKQLLEAALAAGIEPAKLMVGNGLCSIPETVELTRHALDNGCDKVLMLPPFYYKGVSDEGLFAHFCQVIDTLASDKLRIILYHFPKMSAVPLSVDLIARLLKRYPTIIAGIKDSSGDWDNVRALLASFPNMAVFPGSESLMLAGLRHGGAGCITASANVNPTAIRAVFDAWKTDAADADDHHESIDSVRVVFNQFALVSALKFVLGEHRGDNGWRRVRPPMVSLDDTEGPSLMGQLSDSGYQFPR